MENKNYITGVLIAAICIMAVGYASLSQKLYVNGTAEIVGEWDVHLQNPQAGAKTDTATVIGTPSVVGNTFTLNVELLQPGDSVTYTIDVRNEGTIDAKLTNITTPQTGNADDVSWTFTGIAKNDVIKAKNTKTLTMTATFDPQAESVTENQTKNLTVIMDFGQNN